MQLTVNYVKNIHHLTGGPKVVIVKACFRDPIKRKWKGLIKKAQKSKTMVEFWFFMKRAFKCKPTGKPFHDLIMWKGRVPSAKAQFCTEHLKLWPIKFFLDKKYPSNKFKRVMFTGIRSSESVKRSKKQPFMYNGFYDCESVMPLLYESEETVFRLIESKGILPNPLYLNGSSPVGCYPCIYSSKNELKNMEGWAWEKLHEFEKQAFGLTWFPPYKVPGKEITSILDVKEWVQTSRGGRQYDMFLQNEIDNKKETPSCMTGFLNCE